MSKALSYVRNGRTDEDLVGDLINVVEYPRIENTLNDSKLTAKLLNVTLTKGDQPYFDLCSASVIRSTIKTCLLSGYQVTDTNYRSATRALLGNGRQPSVDDIQGMLRIARTLKARTDPHAESLTVRDLGCSGVTMLLAAVSDGVNNNFIPFDYSKSFDYNAIKIAEALELAVSKGFITMVNIDSDYDFSWEEATHENSKTFGDRFHKASTALIVAREEIGHNSSRTIASLADKYDSYVSAVKGKHPVNVTTTPTGMTPAHYDADVSTYPSFYLFTKAEIDPAPAPTGLLKGIPQAKKFTLGGSYV